MKVLCSLKSLWGENFYCFFCDFRDFAGDFIIFWPHCDESKDNNDHGLRFETKKNGCNYRDGADNLFSRVEAQLDEISYVGVSLGCCPLAGQAELFYPGL